MFKALQKIILLSLLISYTLSCSCVISTIQENFNAADRVFEGRVLNKQCGALWCNVTLKATRSFKGSVHLITRVKTAKDSAMCGFNFTVGKLTVVFADRNENGMLETNMCRGTQLSNAALITQLLALANGGKTTKK